MGYYQSGFEILGVDIKPQPNYPFKFIQANALEFDLGGFDYIHASPPCGRYSSLTAGYEKNHPDLYGPTKRRLKASGAVWVMESVVSRGYFSKPFTSGIMLCGSMFGLVIRRHRNFESNLVLSSDMKCRHDLQGRVITISGKNGGDSKHSKKGRHQDWPLYMEMPWATYKECTQAVHPRYSEYIGELLQIPRDFHPEA